MAKSRSRSPKSPAGISPAEANLRIARLSRRPVATFTGRENLDRPVDAAIDITGGAAVAGRRRFYSRVTLKLNDQDVSCCGVVDFQQQVGPCVLRMGGIAGLSTPGKHRFKGYGRIVMDNALRWMRGQGHDVSMLYGISGFYPKFGYAQAFPGVEFSMAVRDAELAPAGGHRFVGFQDRHLKAVLRMYHRNNATRTGITRRDGRTWVPFCRGRSWGPRPVVRVALDSRNRPVGYFALDANLDAAVIETGFSDRAVFGSMLRAVAKLAWAGRLERIRFYLPQDDEFMAFCRHFGLRQGVTYRRDANAMVRLINVSSTLRKLAPLLAARMDGAGRLIIRTNLDDVALAWSGGKMTVVTPRKASQAGSRGRPKPRRSVRLPQWALAQLVYGYQSVEVLSQVGIAKGPQSPLADLARMFPPGPHYHYRVDAF